MTDCCPPSCSSTTPETRRHRCPLNGIEYSRVSLRTVLHHIRKPWEWPAGDQAYFFCDDPQCRVVYFGADNSVVEREQLRLPVGIKENSPDATLCYCFGVSLLDAEHNDMVKKFVTEQTREGLCDCETRNPSGRCCLKDFPNS